MVGVDQTQVILLPGSVLPAGLAFEALLGALGDVDAVAKDLEVYSTPEPPADFSLDTEVEGVLREADSRGWDAFHLVGYSAGGAVALAFTAHHPERLLSLGLLEPAWAGDWDWSPAHAKARAEYEQLETLPPEQFMGAFMRLGVKPEATLPPPPAGEPPPWMSKRPAGIQAFRKAFQTYDLDREALRDFDRPVYLALGGLSKPDDYGEIADRLSTVFPDFRLDLFPERHHFDPPHRIEPDRLAAALRAVWSRS